jgi:hypothetical protein
VDGEEQDEPEPEESECSGCPGQGIDCADECIKPSPVHSASSEDEILKIIEIALKDYELNRDAFSGKKALESLSALCAQLAEARKELSGLDEQINLRLKAEQEVASLCAQLNGPRAAIFAEITAERERQDAKWGEQNHPVVDLATALGLKFFRDQARETCELHAERGSCTWYDILKEEFYEAFAESDPARQREELVQVAAVAVEIIECIDRHAPPENVSCPKCFCIWPAETKTCPNCGHDLTGSRP